MKHPWLQYSSWYSIYFIPQEPGERNKYLCILTCGDNFALACFHKFNLSLCLLQLHCQSLSPSLQPFHPPFFSLMKRSRLQKTGDISDFKSNRRMLWFFDLIAHSKSYSKGKHHQKNPFVESAFFSHDYSLKTESNWRKPSQFCSAVKDCS